MDLYLISITFLYFSFVIWGLLIFKKWNDINPLIIALLSCLFLFRFISIQYGLANWINYDYGIGDSFSKEAGLKTLLYILFGFSLIVASYRYFRDMNHSKSLNDSSYFKIFLFNKRKIIMRGLALGTISNLVLGPQLYWGAGITTSYVLLLPAFASSMIVLGFLLLKYNVTSSARKLIILSLIIINVTITTNPSGRFSFLSWSMIVLLIITDKIGFKRKILMGIPFSALLILMFIVLGIGRYSEIAMLSFVDRLQLSIDSFLEFSDFNGVDGFILIQSVFPEFLNYMYGLNHLSVFLAPIPRLIWPAKPVFAWHQLLAISRGDDFYPVGFGGTLIGDFYMEGGIIAILIFSISYGYLMAKIVNLSNKYNSSQNLLIKGMVFASIFAIMRGGDLAGISATILMSYWPLILFICSYDKFLRDQFVKQSKAAN